MSRRHRSFARSQVCGLVMLLLVGGLCASYQYNGFKDIGAEAAEGWGRPAVRGLLPGSALLGTVEEGGNDQTPSPRETSASDSTKTTQPRRSTMRPERGQQQAIDDKWESLSHLFAGGPAQHDSCLVDLQCDPQFESRQHRSRCAIITVFLGNYELHPWWPERQSRCCELFLFTDANITAEAAGPWRVLPVGPLLAYLRDACPHVKSNGTTGATSTTILNNDLAHVCREGRNAIHRRRTPFNLGKLFKMQFHRLPLPRSVVNPPLRDRGVVIWVDGSILLRRRAVEWMLDSIDGKTTGSPGSHDRHREEASQAATETTTATTTTTTMGDHAMWSVGLWGAPEREGSLRAEVDISPGRRYWDQDVVGHYVNLLGAGFRERWWEVRSLGRNDTSSGENWPDMSIVSDLHQLYVTQSETNARLQAGNLPRPGLTEYFTAAPPVNELVERLREGRGTNNGNSIASNDEKRNGHSTTTVADAGLGTVSQKKRRRRRRRNPKTSFGMWSTHTVVLRMTDERVITLLDEWWRQNVAYSTQDQVGFAGAVWRTQILPMTWERHSVGEMHFVKNPHGSAGSVSKSNLPDCSLVLFMAERARSRRSKSTMQFHR